MNPLKIQEIIEEKRLVYGMRLEKFLIGKVNIFFKKTDEVISSKSFCLYSVLFIFLLSIFLRSTIDIGHDSGFYLKLAEEFASGGKYYYDLFESNFPLSFLLHLIPYYISKISGFSVIIIAEYYINILAILSIFYSHKILQKADFSSGQRNIITTAFAL